MKIAIAGIGYVGLSLAVLLGQKYEVVAYDILPEKINKLNNRELIIKDKDIEEYFKTKELNVRATEDYKEAFNNADYVVICTPTNYDEETNSFDTSNVEDIIKKVKELKIDTTIIIKSTIPLGYTEKIKKQENMDNIIFVPEFLREGKALHDNLYPSRIVIGEKSERAKKFAELLQECALKENIPTKFMNNNEAEAVKLFSNTYLALRVAFFNELDTYAESKNLDTKQIIDGVSLDPRIGNFYNNPSFGFGGYCLPKDTKQLLSNYEDVPQNLIGAIVNSNKTRKEHIAKMIEEKKPKTVGVYKLITKKESDNCRESATKDIIKSLRNNSNVIIYEPTIKAEEIKGIKVINNFNEFANQSDVIIANRFEEQLKGIESKIYTRDLYNRDE